MKALPTVIIDRDGEPVTINESDYRADSMKLFGEKPAAKPKAAPKRTRKPKAES